MFCFWVICTSTIFFECFSICVAFGLDFVVPISCGELQLMTKNSRATTVREPQIQSKRAHESDHHNLAPLCYGYSSRIVY